MELESNLGKMLSVNCKFIRCSTSTYSDKTQTRVPEVRVLVQKKIQTQTKIFCITGVRPFRVQFKFAYRIRPLIYFFNAALPVTLVREKEMMSIDFNHKNLSPLSFEHVTVRREARSLPTNHRDPTLHSLAKQ